MKVSSNCINIIKKYEFLHLRCHIYSWNKKIIGYKHVIKSDERYLKKNPYITIEFANRLLTEDMCKVAEFIESVVHVELKQNQIDALASFLHDVGFSAFKFKIGVKYLNESKYSNAATTFFRLTQKEIKKRKPYDILARRTAEWDLWDYGDLRKTE